MKQDVALKLHLQQLKPSQMTEGEIDAACALRLGLVARLNPSTDRVEIRSGENWKSFSPTRDVCDYGLMVSLA